jgi:hypothetical protein
MNITTTIKKDQQEPKGLWAGVTFPCLVRTAHLGSSQPGHAIALCPNSGIHVGPKFEIVKGGMTWEAAGWIPVPKDEAMTIVLRN